MKKVFVVFVLLIIPILAKAQKPQEFKFNRNVDSVKDRLGWNFGGGTVNVEDGKFYFSFDGSERDANIRNGRIKAGVNKFVHIVMKCNSDVVDMLRLNFKREDGSTKYVNLEMSNDDTEFKTYTFDLTQVEEWDGRKSLSLRFTNNKDKATGSVVIEEIVLNNVATH